MSSIRYRGSKDFLEITKNLDAFGKPEKPMEGTQLGGTISLLSRLLILFLIYKEVSYYNKSNLLFKFKPDINLDGKIRMNVDVTIAMPCIGLSGVDLIDDTKQDVFSYGILKRESTWWDLDAQQRLYFSEMQHVNKFLREEYHSVADLLFKDMLMKETTTSIHHEIPERLNKPNKAYDACRLHGTFLINKVAGILHFISGETLSFGFSNNHWHINDFQRIPTNFTHRINKLSFGDLASRIVQPLEGDEKFIPENSVMQYFIEVVPTEIHSVFSKIDTFQYSVKENLRNIDSHKNSYGMPGIYFKYDWSALKVVVKPDREGLIKFLIRLCSVIAGIITISGILNSLIKFSLRTIRNLFAPHLFHKDGSLLINPLNSQLPIAHSSKSLSSSGQYKNNLIANANTMYRESLPVIVNK